MNSLRYLCLVLVGFSTANVYADQLIGVKDPERAQYNWVMHCRGCHQMDATGSNGGAPNMKGIVAQFLQLKEGRVFLAQVPAVAFVALPDNEVADLLIGWCKHLMPSICRSTLRLTLRKRSVGYGKLP